MRIGQSPCDTKQRRFARGLRRPVLSGGQSAIRAGLSFRKVAVASFVPAAVHRVPTWVPVFPELLKNRSASISPSTDVVNRRPSSTGLDRLHLGRTPSPCRRKPPPVTRLPVRVGTSGRWTRPRRRPGAGSLARGLPTAQCRHRRSPTSSIDVASRAWTIDRPR